MTDQATARRTVRITQLASDLCDALDDHRYKNVENISTRIRNIAVKVNTETLGAHSDLLARLGYDSTVDILDEELAARAAYADLYPQEVGR